MTGSLAIGNTYGMDPYFMQAFAAYNPNFKGAESAQQAMSAAAVQTPSLTPAQSQALQGAQTEGKSSGAGLVLGSLAAIGAGIVLYKAHKAGGEKGIVEGFKKLWKNLTGKGEAKNTFQMRRNESGQWFANVPDRRRSIQGAESDNLKRVGIRPDEVINYGEKGTKASRFSFTHNGNCFEVSGNSVRSYKNESGADMIEKYLKPEAEADKNYRQTINNIIAEIRNGRVPEGVSDVNINSYTHGADGVIRRFKQLPDGSYELEKAVTNRFELNSEQVKAFRQRNEKINTAVKEALEGKIPDNLKIAYAEYPAGRVKVVIKNGKVFGIKIGENVYGKDTDKYCAWLLENEKVLDKISDLTKNKKLENIIYAA